MSHYALEDGLPHFHVILVMSEAPHILHYYPYNQETLAACCTHYCRFFFHMLPTHHDCLHYTFFFYVHFPAFLFVSLKEPDSCGVAETVQSYYLNQSARTIEALSLVNVKFKAIRSMYSFKSLLKDCGLSRWQ